MYEFHDIFDGHMSVKDFLLLWEKGLKPEIHGLRQLPLLKKYIVYMQNQYIISTIRDYALIVMHCYVTNIVVMVTMERERMTSIKLSRIL